MADNVLANLKTVSNLLEFIDLDIAACDGFWDYLSESDVTWGSPSTITLIERDYIKEKVVTFILSDPTDEDNPGFINLINKFFDEYTEEFLVIN